MQRVYKLFAAALGFGASLRDTEFGPQALLDSELFKNSSSLKNVIHKIITHPISSKGSSLQIGKALLPIIVEFNTELALACSNSIKEGEFPIVVGGDHSIAIGTWSGIVNQLKSNKFGLLWIDAHMDAHTPQTSYSKAYHGMPAATLLGYGEEALCQLLATACGKILAKNLIYIGVRSYEPEEKELLQRLDVKIYYMDEVKRRGIAAIIEESIAYFEQNTEVFGVTIDVDAFDPSQSPGTGTKEKDGIDFKEFYNSVDQIFNNKKLCALEIVEFNPKLDVENKTLKIIIELLEKLISK